MDEQQRHGVAGDHLGGGAAEPEELHHPPLAIGAHHQQVGVHALGVLQQAESFAQGDPELTGALALAYADAGDEQRALTLMRGAMSRSVLADVGTQLQYAAILLKTADQKSKLMRVVAPLGVLLPSGLGLKLDNVDVGRAGFVRCLPNGCVAEVVMDDKLLGQLRSAKTATFIIFETPEEGIGFPLSLNGLGEGYDKLP